MSNHLPLGLELTSNSKAGPSFSLSRADSCIYKTSVCAKYCYGNGVRYQSRSSKIKRERNFRTCEYLLAAGGQELLAENLVMLVDQCRPSDWITARVNQVETRVPWTLRIHDIGDFYSAEYVAAWRITVQQRPQCRFWFYTRSFADETIFEVLTSLASEPNCKGWLSIDSENYERGMLAYCKEPKAWGVSLLQEEPSVLPPDMVPAILSNVADGQLVNFPKHHGGRHVPVASSALPSCPQVMGAFLLQTNAALSRPCQSCALCLPSAISI
jgi:hypothetical protein